MNSKKLSDILSFQEGVVASRALVDKKTGTITIFAFDKSQGLSEHTAPYDAFVLVLEGKLDIKIDNKINHLEQNDFLIMPANKPHSLVTKQKSKMMLVMIKEVS